MLQTNYLFTPLWAHFLLPNFLLLWFLGFLGKWGNWITSLTSCDQVLNVSIVLGISLCQIFLSQTKESILRLLLHYVPWVGGWKHLRSDKDSYVNRDFSTHRTAMKSLNSRKTFTMKSDLPFWTSQKIWNSIWRSLNFNIVGGFKEVPRLGPPRNLGKDLEIKSSFFSNSEDHSWFYYRLFSSGQRKAVELLQSVK